MTKQEAIQFLELMSKWVDAKGDIGKSLKISIQCINESISIDELRNELSQDRFKCYANKKMGFGVCSEQCKECQLKYEVKG